MVGWGELRGPSVDHSALQSASLEVSIEPSSICVRSARFAAQAVDLLQTVHAKAVPIAVAKVFESLRGERNAQAAASLDAICFAFEAGSAAWTGLHLVLPHARCSRYPLWRVG
jgi:hypothetical protein